MYFSENLRIDKILFPTQFQKRLGIFKFLLYLQFAQNSRNTFALSFLFRSWEWNEIRRNQRNRYAAAIKNVIQYWCMNHEFLSVVFQSGVRFVVYRQTAFDSRKSSEIYIEIFQATKNYRIYIYNYIHIYNRYVYNIYLINKYNNF